MKQINKITIGYMIKLGFVGALLFSGFARADDTDIFSNEQAPVTPNVLFVFDSSGSMNWALDSDKAPANPADSRLSTLRGALSLLLTDPDLPDVNIGMMNFSGHSGNWLAHGPAYPVASVNADAQTILNSNPAFSHPGISYLPAPVFGATSKDYLQTISNTWVAKGKTPLVDALYEATRYLKGESLYWGKQPPDNLRAAHPSTYSGLITKTSTSSTDYVCKDQACGGSTGVSCNATMSCNTVTELTHICNQPSEAACLAANPGWNSCTLENGSNCSNSCPDGIYDEAGNCVNPVTQCNPYTYYRCTEPVNITHCQHEVCGDVTTVKSLLTGNANYISPINEECQSNYIVLLSDGEPTVNNSSADVENYIGTTFANNCAAGTDYGRCGKELATYLSQTDHRTDLDGEHRINLYTIGLALSHNPTAIQYLKDLAASGDGEYNSADTPEKLVEVFKGLLTSFTQQARSFSSPTYSLDTTSVLSHGDDVYIPVFNPENKSVWPGNLKKFKLKNGQLVDSAGDPATNATGTLRDDARDEWANAADAINNAITDGGAANRLDPDSRRLFTESGVSTLALNAAYPAIKSKLGDASMSNARRDALLNFIRGKNTDGTARHHMGDIIHSKPLHLSYASGGYVFVGTNEGYLHIINDADGSETAAFMPSELLKNIAPQFETVVNGTKSDHLYGIDSEITLWHDDKNQNDIKESDEDAILIFGLRRGGTSYYALNVNTPNNPKLLWKIDSSSTGMSSLAHTWSRPVVANLKYKPNTSPEPVIIFGGGYSDDASGTEISGKGNAVYIVNANTGQLLWSTQVAEGLASNSNTINHAIPGKIRVLDVDRNGSIDRLYFADTGGYIWRADLNASDLDGSGDFGNLNKATLTQLADLGSVSSPATSGRQFFVEPDVAMFTHKSQFVLSIAIGSGDRPHPLDSLGDDRFFVLFDENVLNTPPANSPAITLSDLVSAPVATATDLISKNRTKKGWYLDLAAAGLSGEKVLSNALTFQGMVMFTSFGNGSATPNPEQCEVSTSNVSRLYALNLLNGSAVLDLDGDGTINSPSDNSLTVSYGDISDTPQVIFKPLEKKGGGACDTGDCIRPFEIRVGKAVLGFASNQTSNNLIKLNSIPKVYWIDKNQ